MSEPWGIVVVPTEAGRVLTGELFPPWVILYGSGASVWELWHARSPTVFHHTLERKGLPLWWDGALVPEGWDRARRMWADGVGTADGEDVARLWWPDADEALILARALESADLCRVVLLDLVDGAVVERVP